MWTERKQAEEALQESHAVLKSIMDNVPAEIHVKDVDGRYLTINRTLETLIGVSSEQARGKTSRDFFSDELATAFEHSDRQVMETKKAIQEESQEVQDDGVHHFLTVKYPMFDSNGILTGVGAISTDVTVRKQAEEALSHQATHDALTGLINRAEFERRVRRVLDTAREQYDEHALCYLDLDQFKVINDTCGHMAGDELLRQLGQLLSETVRRRDTLARLGGDEFGVLMEHCTLAQARRVANKVRRAVAEFRFVWEERVFHIGVSIGLVPICETSESIANLLSAADSACYAAKDEGRNRVHVYHLDDSELARRQGEMRWVARIDHALEDQRLQLWSQPIVPVMTDSGEGEQFELLLRLVDERGETILPGVFLPAAERYGLSTKLDRWVVGAALGWLSRNPKLLERLHLCFVNLSGASLADEEFLEFVHQQLEQSQIPSQKICFEVTETATIANLSRAMTFMEALKAQGCRFALDDFGSGLSSFAYLKTLPVDYLKIDGAFVKRIVDDEVDLALVRSINDVGKVMRKGTIAEFVENEAILQKLREIGVDYAQGYGIGRPAPIEETTLFDASVS
jgi:diguanylate cyclase (GGDEF)-like protein/PAS domain S-box-containing protein